MPDNLELPIGIRVTNPRAVDVDYGPYATVADANTAINPAVRIEGRLVWITGTGLHAYQGGTADVNLTPVGGGGGVSVTPGSKILLVDPNGNDTTGARGTFNYFATPSAARSVAQSGDLIIVRPGAYTSQSQLQKAGVNWYFEKGSSILNTSNNQTIFSQLVNQDYEVLGKGVFETRGTNSYVLNTQVGQKVRFEFESMKTFRTEAIRYQGQTVPYSGSSEVVVKGDLIETHASFGVVMGGFVRKGSSFSVKTIICSYDVNGGGSSSGGSVAANGVGFGSAIYLASAKEVLIYDTKIIIQHDKGAAIVEDGRDGANGGVQDNSYENIEIIHNGTGAVDTTVNNVALRGTTRNLPCYGIYFNDYLRSTPTDPNWSHIVNVKIYMPNADPLANPASLYFKGSGGAPRYNIVGEVLSNQDIDTDVTPPNKFRFLRGPGVITIDEELRLIGDETV
jgi:hypothetical protein